MYPAGLLYNIRTNRYHPIIFRFAPTPGPLNNKPIQRHKSLAHHTDGFETKELAVSYIYESKYKFVYGLEFEWDSEKEPIPAIITYLEV